MNGILRLDHFRPGRLGDSAVVAQAKLYAATSPVPRRVSEELSRDAEAEAEVNYGRWIVRCPWCPNAQLASREDPRFLCNNCWNAGVGGAWIVVKWPANVEQVEQVLAARPTAAVQHWHRGETVEDLEEENRRAGRGELPVPEGPPALAEFVLGARPDVPAGRRS